MMIEIMSTWGWYQNAPGTVRFTFNVFMIALAIFFIISAVWSIPQKNNKIKRELIDRDKEAMRLKIANEKASDKYLEYQKENEKLISNKIKMLDEIAALEEKKKLLLEPLVVEAKDIVAAFPEKPEKNKGGRPKGSKTKNKN
jgi:hypothetical protein